MDPSRAQFLVGDFFLHEGTYDLVFDHTFLCALQPVSRPKWAAKMARLIRPGGILVGYIYPINTHTDGMISLLFNKRSSYIARRSPIRFVG